MISHLKKIKETIYKTPMLKHEFYQKWNRGELSLKVLQYYAKEYYHFEELFPRCVALAYSKCDDLKNRRILFENLRDELSTPKTHLDLWVNFADALGVRSEEFIDHKPNKHTQQLLKGFWKLSNKSYASAVAAMYSYETQVPEVARNKIDTLKKHYGMTSEQALSFFLVHLSADQWHSEECGQLLDNLLDREKEESITTAHEASKLLCTFLDGVLAFDRNQQYAN